jgi:hypothetical protein
MWFEDVDYEDRILIGSIDVIIVCLFGYSYRCVTIGVSGMASRSCKAAVGVELSYSWWLVYEPELCIISRVTRQAVGYEEY